MKHWVIFGSRQKLFTPEMVADNLIMAGNKNLAWAQVFEIQGGIVHREFSFVEPWTFDVAIVLLKVKTNSNFKKAFKRFSCTFFYNYIFYYNFQGNGFGKFLRHIKPVCLPNPETTIYGQQMFVAGNAMYLLLLEKLPPGG